MITLRLWAHKIAPMTDSVKPEHFMAIEICNNTATLLAKLFNGKADCSSCGVVQHLDTVTFPALSKEQGKFITANFPFVSIYRPFPLSEN
jgi:hypothetical protein